MKRFLVGVIIGLVIGWVTGPLINAAYTAHQSDSGIVAISPQIHRYYSYGFVEDDNSPKETHTYKGYLNQMLFYMREMNEHLKHVEENTQALKDKLHA